MLEPGQKLAYSVPEAAEALSLSRSTLYKLIKAGDLVTFSWCGRTLIRADELVKAVDRASGREAA